MSNGYVFLSYGVKSTYKLSEFYNIAIVFVDLIF